MHFLNYHHLLYFHTVLQNGSVTAAAKQLRLAQPTLSTQIRQLEDTLGGALLERQGRGVVPTALGRTVGKYAAEIFALGAELQRAAADGVEHRRFAVGVNDTLPKMAVYRLLRPIWDTGVTLTCTDGPLHALLPELQSQRLDVILSDAPVSGGARAYNHELGSCGVSFFAGPALAAALTPDFPRSLHGARTLLQDRESTMRRALDTWLSDNDVLPRIVGEFSDSGLLKAFGQAGDAFYVAPSIVESEITRQYGVVCFGRVGEVRERFWAISGERRVRHPAVQRLVQSGRELLHAA